MKIFSYFILVLFKYLRLFLLSACSFFYLNSKIVYCQENDGKKNKEDRKNQLLSDLNIDDSIKNSIVKKIFDQAVNLYLVVNEISNLHKENLELKKVLDENAFRFFYKNIREKILISFGKEYIIENDELLYLCILDIGLEKITHFKDSKDFNKVKTAMKIVKFLIQDLLSRKEKKPMNWISHYVCFSHKMSEMPEHEEEFFLKLFIKLNILYEIVHLLDNRLPKPYWCGLIVSVIQHAEENMNLKSFCGDDAQGIDQMIRFFLSNINFSKDGVAYFLKWIKEKDLSKKKLKKLVHFSTQISENFSSELFLLKELMSKEKFLDHFFDEFKNFFCFYNVLYHSDNLYYLTVPYFQLMKFAIQARNNELLHKLMKFENYVERTSDPCFTADSHFSPLLFSKDQNNLEAFQILIQGGYDSEAISTRICVKEYVSTRKSNPDF